MAISTMDILRSESLSFKTLYRLPRSTGTTRAKHWHGIIRRLFYTAPKHVSTNERWENPTVNSVNTLWSETNPQKKRKRTRALLDLDSSSDQRITPQLKALVSEEMSWRSEGNENLALWLLQFVEKTKDLFYVHQVIRSIFDDLWCAEHQGDNDSFLSLIDAIDASQVVNCAFPSLLPLAESSMIARNSIQRILSRPDINSAVLLIKFSRWVDDTQSSLACRMADFNSSSLSMAPRSLYSVEKISQVVNY